MTCALYKVSECRGRMTYWVRFSTRFYKVCEVHAVMIARPKWSEAVELPGLAEWEKMKLVVEVIES